MSGEQFDSGAVLSRATPVLTFGSLERAEKDAALRSASSHGPRGDDSPDPSFAWHEDVRHRDKGPTLPVIPRIVRRTRIGDGALLQPVVAAAHAAKRAGVGTLVFAAMGLATLGAIAGLGMRSLSDEQVSAAAAVAPPAPELAVPAHASDAVAAERLLARSTPAPRWEHAPALASASTLAHAPSPSSHVRPLHPPPPHQAFAAAHAAHAATRKHAATTALARR
ncbi:MAG TPA: hypothetical protein VIF09_15065 [Polyangiaceae bacterium]